MITYPKPIKLTILAKTVLNRSYNKCISVELSYFDNSKTYQIISGNWAGDYLTKNKIRAFRKYIEIRQSIDKINNKDNYSRQIGA